jgi:hypothetical protein
MPEIRRRLGTAPLACAGEALRRSGEHLAALSEACARPCAELLTALEALPAAARCEPFPPETLTGFAVTAEGAPSRSRSPAGGRSREAAVGWGEERTAPGLVDAVPASPHPAKPRRRQRVEGEPPTLAGQRLPAADTLPARERPAPAPQSTATPASLGGAVAALMARWPGAAEGAPAHAVPPPLPAGASLANTPLGPLIQNLVAQSSGRPTTGHSAPARQFARLPVEFGAATAAAVAEWLASHAPAPAVRPTSLGAALAGEGPSLLAQLVAGVAPAPQGNRQPVATPRQPAPRARSRLTDAASPETGARRAKEAPAGDPQPGQEAGELAQQLNRLLLDQAWLRGVDLT